MFYRAELQAIAYNTLDEEEGFEALAWLRWVLLAREGDAKIRIRYSKYLLEVAYKPVLNSHFLHTYGSRGA